VNLGWIGIGLLAVLFVTGFRNLFAGFRRDISTSGLKMAYFMVAIIYNMTEAAFRTQNPVWILFLLSIVAVPAIPSPKSRTIPGPNDTATQDDQIGLAVTSGIRKEAM
jgi:hypothetical protein